MLEKIPSVVGQALRSIRPGLTKLTYAAVDAPETIALRSEAFADGASLPPRCTADGSGASPAIFFSQIPPSATSLVLIVEDADSPTPAPLCHALAWNISASTSGLNEAALGPPTSMADGNGVRLGKNSFLSDGWLPPDPPTGHGPHRYCFQVFALDVAPDLEPGAGRGAVVAALRGHVLAKGLLVGTYERA